MELESPRLLVAEDDPGSAALLYDLVSTAGYRCQVVTDGDATIRAGQLETPDLILLDLRIPGRNGFEVCEQLKADPRTAHIPVIVITAFGEEHCRLRAIEAGADDFLTKPVNRAELYARIRALLRLRRCLAERETPEAVIGALFLLIRLYDARLGEHCRLVSTLAGATARYAGLEAHDVRTTEQAGLIHDLGKVVGRNTSQHPELGARIISCLGPLSRLAPLVRGHHERWDGNSFPDGVRNQIGRAQMQIIAAANAWAHLLTGCGALPPAREALAEQVRSGWWNPALFEPLVRAASSLGERTGTEPNQGGNRDQVDYPPPDLEEFPGRTVQ